MADAGSNNDAKLALIYSRLKALEIEKEQPHPILEIQRRIGAAAVSEGELEDIATIFRDTTAGVRQRLQDVAEQEGKLLSAELFHQESVHNVRVLFLAEEQYAQSLVRSLEEKVRNWRAVKSERDQNVNQMFQKRQGLLAFEERIKELEEICRSLQKLAKDKDDLRAQLVQQEQEKTSQLQSECLQSIAAVSKKIEEEELDLADKAKENDELRSKLDQFTYHMRLRREKVKNEERARELQQKLEEARRAQSDYFREQEKLQAQSLRSRVVHLEETVHGLRSQLASYAGKFEEFEDTLRRSAAVLEKVDEREAALQEILSKMRSEGDALKKKAAEADVSVIRAIEQKRVEENEFLQTKASLDKLEKKCRKLMLRRQELMKLQEARGAAVPSSSSCSSSSSSSAAMGKESAVRREHDAGRGSPPNVPSSSSAAEPRTPTRRIHNFVMSSSASPARPPALDSLVGDGSPVTADRKQA